MCSGKSRPSWERSVATAAGVAPDCRKDHLCRIAREQVQHAKDDDGQPKQQWDANKQSSTDILPHRPVELDRW